MCLTCGCAIVGDIAINSGKDLHPHNHARDRLHHHHDDSSGDGKHWHTISVHQGILNKNDRLAEQNREYFKTKGIFVLNILSSPGSGKTAFIERMLRDRSDRIHIGVIVGDLETDNDALRLRSHGVPAVQITTGNTCH